MSTKEKREMMKKVGDTLRAGTKPSDEEVNQLAGDAVELFGNLLISIDVSLKKISEKL